MSEKLKALWNEAEDAARNHSVLRSLYEAAPTEENRAAAEQASAELDQKVKDYTEQEQHERQAAEAAKTAQEDARIEAASRQYPELAPVRGFERIIRER